MFHTVNPKSKGLTRFNPESTPGYARKTDTVISYLSYECGHSSEKDNALHFKKRLQASNIQW